MGEGTDPASAGLEPAAWAPLGASAAPTHLCHRWVYPPWISTIALSSPFSLYNIPWPQFPPVVSSLGAMSWLWTTQLLPWAQPHTEQSPHNRTDPRTPCPRIRPLGAPLASRAPTTSRATEKGTPKGDVPWAGGMEPTHTASGARWASVGLSGHPVLRVSPLSRVRGCSARCSCRTRALGRGTRQVPAQGLLELAFDPAKQQAEILGAGAMPTATPGATAA